MVMLCHAVPFILLSLLLLLLLSLCVGQVRDGLVPLITELREKGTAPDDAWLKGKFDVDKQVGLSQGGGACWSASRREAMGAVPQSWPSATQALPITRRRSARYHLLLLLEPLALTLPPHTHTTHPLTHPSPPPPGQAV